jgi:hypothetical protein
MEKIYSKLRAKVKSIMSDVQVLIAVVSPLLETQVSEKIPMTYGDCYGKEVDPEKVQVPVEENKAPVPEVIADIAAADFMDMDGVDLRDTNFLNPVRNQENGRYIIMNFFQRGLKIYVKKKNFFT